jgi:hypothetical protein
MERLAQAVLQLALAVVADQAVLMDQMVQLARVVLVVYMVVVEIVVTTAIFLLLAQVVLFVLFGLALVEPSHQQIQVTYE